MKAVSRKNALAQLKYRSRLFKAAFLVGVFAIACAVPDALGQASDSDETDNSEGQAGTQSLMARVSARAQTLAEKKFETPDNLDSAVLRNMTYQQYRAINFKSDHALWRDEGLFEVQFFHPGFLYRHPVTVHEVAGEDEQTVAFSTEQFEYRQGAQTIPEKLDDAAGFAGFRVHFPLNNQEHKDELAVFLGASYFRLVGPGQIYGLSARGLAIDTAAPSGEEFPLFREFWLVQPEEGSSELILYALLDSPSVAGAYRFAFKPGISTSVQVEAQLYPRTEIAKLGIAPLTSMFFYGENSTRFFDDFRPEVHDSDGLLMYTSAQEWTWRPLTNPQSLRVVSLSDTNPRGFGLVQRDREFDNYLDSEADYHMRPSHWVEPVGEWGAGRVELVEIPTSSETNDNIVAYWVPQEKIEAGKEYRYSYRLSTFNSRLPIQDKAQVLRTRIGSAAVPGEANPPPDSHRRFVVDFVGAGLTDLAPNLKLEANLTVNLGDAKDVQVQPLPEKGRWRVVFELIPDGKEAVDMRLSLSLRGQQISEVWNYVWSPNAIGK